MDKPVRLDDLPVWRTRFYKSSVLPEKARSSDVKMGGPLCIPYRLATQAFYCASKLL